MTLYENTILYLDAGHYTSYPGSGNVWYDISGNDFHATPIEEDRFPEWQSKNDGRFYFNGSKGLKIDKNVPLSTENSSFEFWFRVNSTKDVSRFLFDARNGNGRWWTVNKDNNININNDIKVNDPPEYEPDSNLHNRWVHCVVTGNNNGSKIFIDGKGVTDDRLINSNPVNFGIGEDLRIGCRYNDSQKFRGYFGLIRLYDVELTEEQIEDRYWNTKTRFRT